MSETDEPGSVQAARASSGRGESTSTVRHTPARYAELKAAAEQAGRSISEEVEYRLERDARADAQHQEDLAQLHAHQQQLWHQQHENGTLREELTALKQNRPSRADIAHAAMDDERIVRIVTSAIAAYAEGKDR